MAEEGKSATLDDLVGLLRKIGDVPRPWIAILSIAAVLSTFEISHTHDGGLSIGFKLTSLTIAVLALAWLPFALRIFALVGGGVKVAGGELRSTGLLKALLTLDPKTQKATLPPIIASLSLAETKVGPIEQNQIRLIRQEAESRLASLPSEDKNTRQELEKLAADYVTIRASMPPGNDRIIKMSEVVIRARALAQRIRFDETELQQWLFPPEGPTRPGRRVVGLALLTIWADPRPLPSLLKMAEDPLSPFEQYQALAAILAILGKLGPSQRQATRTTIERLLESDILGIGDDSDRRNLCRRILSTLDALERLREG